MGPLSRFEMCAAGRGEPGSDQVHPDVMQTLLERIEHGRFFSDPCVVDWLGLSLSLAHSLAAGAEAAPGQQNHSKCEGPSHLLLA